MVFLAVVFAHVSGMLLPCFLLQQATEPIPSLLASLIHCCIAPWPYESWVTADRNMTDPSDSENPKLSKLPYLCLPPKSGSQVSIHLVSQVDLAFVSRSLLYILSLYLSQLLPGLVWWSFWTLVPIGRFSEAGLLEWMRFVIFCERSCSALPGRFLSKRCFTLCITVEVEPRIAKQYKCQYCCSCKNYRGEGIEGGNKVSLHHFLADQKIESS